jgi:hypothetical protein
MMSRRKWTLSEILTLILCYPREGPYGLALHFGRSEDSVSSQARRCGLRTFRRSYRRRSGHPIPRRN